ncbi:VOC family protein [Pseudomonas sp. 22526]|uniref:VOC family protein n=1 Tax=Pseudomonas sp. 22526 TaxID=3453937 RepID=UPI003F86CE85
MELKFSHVDVLVQDLEAACAYYARILKARISRTLVWERGGLHVRYADENGQPLTRANLQSPSGASLIWLPKRFGHFSIEILEEQALEAFIQTAFA